MSATSYFSLFLLVSWTDPFLAGFCSNNWNISAKGEGGRIDLSWQPPSKQTKSGYTYLVVHKSSARDARANFTNSTLVVIDNLDPNTEYSIQVIAIPLTNEQSPSFYSCNKRVRTKKGKWTLKEKKPRKHQLKNSLSINQIANWDKCNSRSAIAYWVWRHIVKCWMLSFHWLFSINGPFSPWA